MILQPGIHYDIKAEFYHADPAPEPSLSSSIGKLLLDRTPAHAWTAHPRLNPGYVHKDETKFDLGTAAHARALEQDPSRYEIIHAPDYRTKAAREKRDEALKLRRVPILAMQWDLLEDMETARIRFCQSALGSDPFSRFSGPSEVTAIFKQGTIYGRARIDKLPDVGPYFWDYKTTTNASFDKVERKIFDLGYDFQAAFHAHALGMATDQIRSCMWLFQETEAPFACALYALDEEAARLADNRVARALQAWAWCQKTDRWPEYPPHIGNVMVPPYLDRVRMVQEDRLATLTRDRDDSD